MSTEDLKEWDAALDRANYQMKWAARFFFGVVIMGLLLIIFSPAQAHAFTVSPAFIPDPTYPSGTHISTDDNSKYYVGYREDNGQNVGGRWNSGDDGSHPWGFWFDANPSGATTRVIVVQMTNSGSSSGTECGYGAGMTLSDCRDASNYLDEFPVCLTDNTACEGGGEEGTTTATSTSSFSTTTQMIDNPSQNVFNGVLLFFIGLFLAIWLQRKH